MQRLSAVFFLILLIGCGGSNYQTLDSNAVILAFGDSLTAGVGTSKENNYPTVLAQMSGRRVVNAGISGETTAGGLQRFADLLDQHSPSLVILLEGGNDILRNIASGNTKNNLAEMIGAAKQRQIPLLLIGVPERSWFSNSADFYEELAAEHEVLFMDDMVADLLRSPGLKSDAVHLNAAGYRQMAREIFDFLGDHGLF